MEEVLCRVSDEILLQIFGYLPIKTLGRLAQVSKRFKKVAYNESLWRTVTFGYQNVATSTKLEGWLARGCIELKLIECKVRLPLLSLQTKNSTIHSCKLEKLELSYVNMQMKDFLIILSRCTNLKHLVLGVFFITFNEEMCNLLAKNVKLEIITSASGEELQYQGLLAIARGCKSLVEFCVNTYKKEFKTSQADLMTLVEDLPSTIKIFRNFSYNTNFNDDHMQTLVTKLPNLEKLWFEGCRNLTGEAVEHITKLNKLTCLDISNCDRISLAAIKKLQKLPQLSEVWVCNMKMRDNREELQALLPRVTFHF